MNFLAPEFDPANFELTVTARPFEEEDGTKAFVRIRDLYLCERDPADKAARSLFLCHPDCPVSLVVRIIKWAKLNNIPVHEDPSGNMAPGWAYWPENVKPAAKKVEATF